LRTLCLLVAIVAVCLAGLVGWSGMWAAAARADLLAARQQQYRAEIAAAQRAWAQRQPKVEMGSKAAVPAR
jgi:hypothetical protein